MKVAVLLLTIASAALTPLTASADARDMPSGLWEIRTKMDIPGLPPEMAAQMGNRAMTHCVKPGEGKWTDQRGPNDRGDKKCEALDTKTDGNKMMWKMKCADGTTGEGVVTHNGKDAYTSEMTINTKQGTMKMKSEGKRIAATCDKK